MNNIDSLSEMFTQIFFQSLIFGFVFYVIIPFIGFLITLWIIDLFYGITKVQKIKHKVYEKLDFLLDDMIEKKDSLKLEQLLDDKQLSKKDLIDLLNKKGN